MFNIGVLFFNFIEQRSTSLSFKHENVGESHFFLSEASAREEEQRQRIQARRETSQTRLAQETPSQMQMQLRVEDNITF